jgi:hypothetical protein
VLLFSTFGRSASQAGHSEVRLYGSVPRKANAGMVPYKAHTPLLRQDERAQS